MRWPAAARSSSLHNRSEEPARALAAELGARVASTAREAAADADVAITMLADGDAVRAVWDGPDGLVAGAHPGGVLVNTSTVPPDTLAPFEAAARERGSGILDAPVSGSTVLAASGQLTIMAGGTADDLERARPALDMVAKQVTHVGPLGSGAALKLAVNALIFAISNSVSEALVLAERAGIDRALAYEVFASSAAGAPFVGYKRDAFVNPDGDSRRLLDGPGAEGPAPDPRPGGRARRPDATVTRQSADHRRGVGRAWRRS